MTTNFLLIFLAILLLFLLLFLLWPLSFRIYFSFEKQFNYKYKVGFPFLMYACKKEGNNREKYLKFFIKKISLASAEKEKSAETTREEKGGFSWLLSFDTSEIFEIINKDSLFHMGRFILSLLKIIKLDRYFCNLTVSTSEPYYDGIIMALYYSFIYPLLGSNIKLKPGKNNMVFKVKGEIAGSFIPGKILYRVIIFILSPRSIKLFYNLWKVR